jgi:MSHA biogenesis protein MshJ
MKPFWNRYVNWFAALKPRERVLVAFAALALAAFVPFAVALEPQWRDSRRFAAQIERQEKDLVTMRTDSAALASSSMDPDSVTREQITLLQRQMRELDETLRATRKGLVPADQMPKLLERLLEGNRGLRVVALRTLPGVPLISQPAVVNPAAPAPDATASAPVRSLADASGLHKYGVEIVIEGSYADLTTYLDQIEKLPSQMFWSRAVMDAAAYPRVTLSLSLFTLGLESAWLSV